MAFETLLHSDAGLITGWVLFLLGAGDLAFAWWAWPKHRDILASPHVKNLFTAALFGSIFCTLLGLYFIVRH